VSFPSGNYTQHQTLGGGCYQQNLNMEHNSLGKATRGSGTVMDKNSHEQQNTLSFVSQMFSGLNNKLDGLIRDHKETKEAVATLSKTVVQTKNTLHSLINKVDLLTNAIHTLVNQQQIEQQHQQMPQQQLYLPQQQIKLEQEIPPLTVIDVNFIKNNFPITSVEGVNAFNEKLMDPIFKEQMVSFSQQKHKFLFFHSALSTGFAPHTVCRWQRLSQEIEESNGGHVHLQCVSQV
jgi:hypothetical protein